MEAMIEQAKAQYACLEEICESIVQSGNWQKVGASDVKLFLNMYVQSVLLRMAQEDGTLGEKTLAFIAQVPEKDVLQVANATPERARMIAYKNRSFAQGVPLLLRCCVARDEKDGTPDAEAFVSALTRMLQLQAACEEEMSQRELHFITTYIGQLRAFISKSLPLRGESAFAAKREEKATSRQEAAQDKNAQAQTKPEEKERTLEELRAQLDELMETGQLARSAGMLTDSRSFTSFPRHEYYRRILCDKLGQLVDGGQYPVDIAALGHLVENVCWRNAAGLLDISV